MMTDEEFINYCMSMHYLTPDQKLIFLKHLVASMQKDYVKPSFIVTSEEELNQKLEEGMKSAKEGKCLSVEEAFKQIKEDFNISNFNSISVGNCRSGAPVEVLRNGYRRFLFQMD